MQRYPLLYLAALLVCQPLCGCKRDGGPPVVLPSETSASLQSGEDYQCIERHQDNWPLNALEYNAAGSSLCLQMQAASSQSDASAAAAAEAFFLQLKAVLQPQDYGENTAANMVLLYLNKPADRDLLTSFLSTTAAYVKAEGTASSTPPPFPPQVAFQVYQSVANTDPESLLALYQKIMAPCVPGYNSDNRVCDTALTGYGFLSVASSVPVNVTDPLLVKLRSQEQSDAGETLWGGIELAQSLGNIDSRLRKELAKTYWLTGDSEYAEVVGNMWYEVNDLMLTIEQATTTNNLDGSCLDSTGVLQIIPCIDAVISQ